MRILKPSVLSICLLVLSSCASTPDVRLWYENPKYAGNLQLEQAALDQDAEDCMRESELPDNEKSYKNASPYDDYYICMGSKGWSWKWWVDGEIRPITTDYFKSTEADQAMVYINKDRERKENERKIDQVSSCFENSGYSGFETRYSLLGFIEGLKSGERDTKRNLNIVIHVGTGYVFQQVVESSGLAAACNRGSNCIAIYETDRSEEFVKGMPLQNYSNKFLEFIGYRNIITVDGVPNQFPAFRYAYCEEKDMNDKPSNSSPCSLKSGYFGFEPNLSNRPCLTIESPQ